MIKHINIKNHREAIAALKQYQDKKYFNQTIRIRNVQLKKINSVLKYIIFDKNDLYIDTETLFEIMQPTGGKGKHNYHGLTPEEILDSLNAISEPYCVFEDEFQKYAIITTSLTSNMEQIMVIVAIGSGTYIDYKACVNKIVTIFPKRNAEKYVDRINPKKILYKNEYSILRIKK